MTATVVDIERLTKTFSGRPSPAVAGVTLGIDAGALVALLGPSGSGKSTILKLIAGIERPDAGDVRLDDASIMRVPAHRRGVVMVFQKPYLYPFMNVFDNVAFGLRVTRADRKTVRAEVGKALELVELPGVERRRPGALSGGEQQRVALARALVTRPRLLMLDEPLSSLDPSVRQSLQSAIRRLQRELTLTTILVTHDLGEAVAMADRVALLEHGELIADDVPQQLFERPPTTAAARFVGVTTFLEGRLQGDRLATELGSIAVRLAPGPGRQAVFAIRPENIELSADAGPASFAGVVKDLEYRGEYTEIRLVVQGRAVRVRCPGTCPLAVGDGAFVRFAAEHLFEVRDGA